MSSNKVLDKTGLTYLWSKFIAYLENIFPAIGNSDMGTEATTVTGAIAQHSQDIEDLEDNKVNKTQGGPIMYSATYENFYNAFNDLVDGTVVCFSVGGSVTQILTNNKSSVSFKGVLAKLSSNTADLVGMDDNGDILSLRINNITASSSTLTYDFVKNKEIKFLTYQFTNLAQYSPSGYYLQIDNIRTKAGLPNDARLVSASLAGWNLLGTTASVQLVGNDALFIFFSNGTTLTSNSYATVRFAYI